jgi:hypothetical protein
MTATYRLLEDHYINDVLLEAGTTVTDTGAGAQIPVGWKPTLNCEPLDSGGLAAFYAQPPGLAGLVRAQWTTQAVNPAVTYWVATPGPVTSWSLTGLGSGLAPVFY